MSIEWLCTYRCAICGEIVYSGAAGDCDDAHQIALDVIMKGTHAGIINYKMIHTCKDGSVGICDFIGITKKEEKDATTLNFSLEYKGDKVKVFGFVTMPIEASHLTTVILGGYVLEEELKKRSKSIKEGPFFSFHGVEFYTGDYEGSYAHIISKESMSLEQAEQFIAKLRSIYNNCL